MMLFKCFQSGKKAIFANEATMKDILNEEYHHLVGEMKVMPFEYRHNLVKKGKNILGSCELVAYKDVPRILRVKGEQ